MSKVICDICGTMYPETAENCPICGCSREYGVIDYEDDLIYDAGAAASRGRGGRFSSGNMKKKNREIFDFDEVNPDEDEFEEEEEYIYESEEPYEEEPRHNTVLVVILVIVIALLLVTVGFLYFRFFLPNNKKEPETETKPVVTSEVTETTVPETDDGSIPCTGLTMPGGRMVFTGKGFFRLLNVTVFPENTTDTISYASENEAVATVDENGRITAVGEGETVIVITCGAEELRCSVQVNYSLATDPTTPVSVPAPSLPEEDAQNENVDTPSETGAEEGDVKPVVPEQTQPETQAPEETKAETTGGGNTLKLKTVDITFYGRYSSADIEMDCDIPIEDVNWFTMDSTIAIIVDGVITATGPGLTRIIGEYNGQQVECIVRCNF